MTTFKGHKSGFNRSGSNSCVPNADAPTTTFCGRGAMPAGKLKNTPSLTGATSAGNRRLAKNGVGDGGGAGAAFKGVNAFSKKR